MLVLVIVGIVYTGWIVSIPVRKVFGVYSGA